jgi:glycerophosphoryl diester phosphodiesterase
VTELHGHRGARGLFPENSVEGVLGALALGVDGIEIDVRSTRDGQVVLYHDARLSPETTRGRDGRFVEPPTPAIDELRFEELAGFDVGRLHPGRLLAARFPKQAGRDGVRIPRLADVLRAAAGYPRVRWDIEVKLTPDVPGDEAEALVGAVVRVLRAEQVIDRADLLCFDWRALRHAERIAPELGRVALTTEAIADDTVRRGARRPSPWHAGLDLKAHGGSVPRLVHALGASAWAPRFGDLRGRPDELAEARRLGLRVLVWTVNDPDDVEAAVGLGVDAVITDRPDIVAAFLPRKRRPG